MSQLQTKQWRNTQEWYVNGKRNECEKYQFRLLSLLLPNLIKTNDRLNLKTKEIRVMRNNFNTIDCFQWSETFDFSTKINETKLYFNLKFICGEGGAQRRALQLSYHFIEAQTKITDDNLLFINIFDGDFCFKFKSHFSELVKNSKNVFFGDMEDFKFWWNFNKFRF